MIKIDMVRNNLWIYEGISSAEADYDWEILNYSNLFQIISISTFSVRVRVVL